MSPKDSLDALRQLLELGGARKDYHDVGYSHHHQDHCWISNPPQKVSYTQYGEEYCFVEVTCPDGSQYGIQAFGDEAIALYTKANRCIMCGNDGISSSLLFNEVADKEESAVVRETINGAQYFFDSPGCALTFKKLRNAYGQEFSLNN
jgi:YHS domain-containing protein